MGALPPPIPGRKNIRFARMMNVMLPGSGLFYLGWRKSGLLLAVGFSICFLGLVGIFVVGYTRYLSIALGDDLMKGNNLEQAGEAFHHQWLIGLAIAGVMLYAVSSVLFMVVRKKLE